MQVRFANTRGELFRFYLAFIARSPLIWLSTLLLLGWIGWNSIQDLPGPFTSQGPSPAAKVVADVLSVAFFEIWSLLVLAIVLLIGCVLLLRTRASKELLRERTYTLTESALIGESASGRTERTWSGILQVRRNHRMIFIVTSDGRPILVPKRAFASAADAEAFFHVAFEYWRRAAVPV